MEQCLLVCTLIFTILTQCMAYTDTSRLSFPPNKLISFSIPQNRELKKNLGFNEDIYLNFTELATKYEYPTEVHSVTTEDGYILTVFRLLPKCSDNIKPYPVMMMHGILDTADMWIVSGTRIGLGYVLASNCYDVWAANSRGNNYSRRHVKLDPNTDRKYWNYSFDEHGNYDLPAVMDYILQNTGQSKLFYVGHSQGSTSFFVMGSLRPEYSNKVRLAVQLGPVAWMKNIGQPLAVLAAHNYMAIKAFAEAAGWVEVFPRDRLVHFLFEFVCHIVPPLCDIGLAITTGYKPGTISIKDIPVAFGHLFSGTSVKNLAHFSQLIISGNFQRFNEGSENNLKRYGSSRTPLYNISQITSPVLLVSAENDYLSNLKDVSTIASKLPNLVENYVVPEPYWSHHNHVWGSTAPEQVYSKILENFNKYKD